MTVWKETAAEATSLHRAMGMQVQMQAKLCQHFLSLPFCGYFMCVEYFSWSHTWLDG